MTFSDKNVKELKEDLANLSDDEGVHVSLFKALLARLEASELLHEWLTHESPCPFTLWECGEPTGDGHYRTKYAGKWYRDNEKPKCTCGLDEQYGVWRKAAEKQKRQ